MEDILNGLAYHFYFLTYVIPGIIILVLLLCVGILVYLHKISKQNKRNSETLDRVMSELFCVFDDLEKIKKELKTPKEQGPENP